MSVAVQAQDRVDTLSVLEADETAIITIEGMACQEGCADAIRSNLKNLSGVHSAMVSFASGQANIEFNPKEISLDSLKSVITATKVKDYIYTIKEVVLVEEK